MGQLDHRTEEELEEELRDRALAHECELLTGTDRHGRFLAAFVRFRLRVGRRGVVLLDACSLDRRVALESLLAADAERPPHR